MEGYSPLMFSMPVENPVVPRQCDMASQKTQIEYVPNRGRVRRQKQNDESFHTANKIWNIFNCHRLTLHFL